MRSYALIVSLLIIASATCAWAQAADNSAMTDRLNRLERDVSFLQRQAYRGAASTDPNAPAPEGVPVAQNQVKLAQVQEEIRQLRGLIEDAQFANRQNTAAIKKLTDDVNYRLQALEQKQAVAEPATPPAAVPPAAASTEKPAPEAAKKEAAEKEAAVVAKEKEEAPALTGKDFPDANAHYNYAFKLLNEKNYSAAATSFDEFVKKYPKDPLTSNAYYWLGESYYARNDFTRAADAFRKGFENNPDGQKAPDNLYKLAVSLANVKRVNEACVVLTQVISKYGDAAPRTRDRAINERTTLQCK